MHNHTIFKQIITLDETLFTEQHHWHNHKGPACWESEYHLSCRDEPFVENEHQGKVNVDKILDKFVKYILSRVKFN